jgi:hypothetical protein
MLNFKNYIQESSWYQELEEKYKFKNVVLDCINSAIENFLYDNKKAEDFENFYDKLQKQLVIDETNLLDFSTDELIDWCMYAQEYNQEKTPRVDWEYLNMAISKQAVEGLKIMVDKKLKQICQPFEDIIDAYTLINFNISSNDPFENFPPTKVENKGKFSIYYYEKIENDPKSNWIVLSTTLLNTDIFFYQKTT